MNNPPVIQRAEINVLKTLKCEFESHLGDHPIYGINHIIYGPYQSKKDLRRRLIIHSPDGVKITISYARFILECKLKRVFDKTEEAHHKNGLEIDDCLDNLEVINSTEHRKIHKTKLPEYYNCFVCGILIQMSGKRLSDYNRNKLKNPNMKGPFCSRQCQGKICN